jgi:hypothetical protein
MTDAKKRSSTKRPAEQPETKPPTEKTPKAGKGAKASQPKAEAPEGATQKPPLPTIQPIGKPASALAQALGKTPQQPSAPSPRPNVPGTPQPTPPAFPQARQPTGLFGSARPNARVTWEILPTHDGAVRIDVSRLPTELFAMLGIRPPTPKELEDDTAKGLYWGSALSGVPSAVAQVMSDYLDVTPDAEKMIKGQLDDSWAALGFTGAVMVFNWREEARVSFATRFQAMGLPTVVLRATDPLLVLNILSRARSGTLISNMPAALEKPFLERQIFTDDARVIAWVKASGCIEEILVEPTPFQDDETAET